MLCSAALAHLDYEAEGLARIAKASPLLHTPQPCLVDTFGPGASFLAAERVVKGKATKEYQKLLGQGVRPGRAWGREGEREGEGEQNPVLML